MVCEDGKFTPFIGYAYGGNGDFKGKKYINKGLSRIDNINKYQLVSVNRLKSI